MKHIVRMGRLLAVFAIVVLSMVGMLTAPVSASTQATPVLIADDLGAVTDGIGSEVSKNTFYAAGRHWEMYLNDDADIVYRSSETGTDSTWSAEVEVVANTMLYGPEFACWYDKTNNKIHYVRHELVLHQTIYRMGTPLSSGTITWATAEQLISATPSDLLTFRVNICVDIDGYPWVAWIDTNGIGSYGILYIQSSSTKDGTWTVDVSATIDDSDYHVWFAQLTPVQHDPYPLVEVEYSVEDISGGPGDGTAALFATDDLSTFVTITTVVALSSMNVTRPDAFSFHNMGASVIGVYTDAMGDVYSRGRSSIETWDTADPATKILDAGATLYLPTVSQFRQRPGIPGYDYMCIVNNNTTLRYAIMNYGGAWSTFTTIWTLGTPGTVNRHVASYDNGSPLGFSWQVTTDSGEDVYYWWFDEQTDGGDPELGYYTVGDVETGTLALANVLPYIFVGIALLGMLVFLTSGGFSVATLIILTISAIVAVVGVGVILNALDW